MYNRYVPGKNGVYERHTIAEPCTEACDNQTPPCKPEPSVQREEIAQQQSCPNRKEISGMDLGDLLLLCIVILLVIDSEEDDVIPLLIMAAAFLFLQ